MLNRRKEREIVFQMLFSAYFFPETETEDLYLQWMEEQEEKEVKESEYIRSRFFGARAFAEEAKAIIAEHARDWDLNRISKTVQAILLLAVYEIKHCPDLPVKIAINEAVLLAKRFGEDKASRFVNGILASVAGKE